MSLRSKFKRANRSLDRGDYQKAIELYQEIIKEKPMSNVLVNLSITTEMYYINFLNESIQSHPDSSVLQAFRARAFNRYGHSEKGWDICTEVIENYELTDGMREEFYFLRFRSAIKSGIKIHILEDFLYSWEALSSGKGKKKLLSDFLSVMDINFIDVFTDLSKSQVIPPQVRNLFVEKVKILRKYSEINPTDIK
jgi:tetratricopeptide (TPR) repeat protein